MNQEQSKIFSIFFMQNDKFYYTMLYTDGNVFREISVITLIFSSNDSQSFSVLMRDRLKK